MQLDEGNLRISNLVEEDEGKYECAATNNKGTRLSSGDNLLVRGRWSVCVKGNPADLCACVCDSNLNYNIILFSNTSIYQTGFVVN